MTNDVENLILERLRRIDGRLDTIQGDIREIKERLGILEQQYASMSTRLDRLDQRVELIERRGALAEA
ncbi:MAG: hypothetical protein ACJ8G4_24660, partial [Burkholderiales bacterium]